MHNIIKTTRVKNIIGNVLFDFRARLHPYISKLNMCDSTRYYARFHLCFLKGGPPLTISLANTRTRKNFPEQLFVFVQLKYCIMLKKFDHFYLANTATEFMKPLKLTPSSISSYQGIFPSILNQ